VEMSAYAAASARSRGFDIVTGQLSDAAYPDGRFDAVTLFDVMEHLPDPVPVLEEAHRILRPGGLLVMGTGDRGTRTATLAGSRWSYMAIPDHICFYDQRAMADLAERTGFVVEDAIRFQHGGSGPSVGRAWRRCIIKHWTVSVFGPKALRAPIFHDKAEDFVVPFYNDHRLWVAARG